MVAITALNGALPASALSTVARAFLLRHDAAASYARARAAGAPAGITTAYRTKAQQKALLDLYGYPRAEYPGYSQHGEGVALDIPEPARAWFVAHGKAYGWVRTVMPSEPWHFEYQPARDVTATTPPTTTEDDMLDPADLTEIHGIVYRLWREPEIRQIIRDAVLDEPVARDASGPTTFLQDTVNGTTAALATTAQLAALTAAVHALATSQGADPDLITAAAQAGARAALADLTLTAHLA